MELDLNTYGEFMAALRSIKEKNVTSLTLMNDTQVQVFDTPMFNEIVNHQQEKFQYLKKIEFCWVSEMIEREILSLIINFPNLNEIIFGCSQEFD